MSACEQNITHYCASIRIFQSERTLFSAPVRVCKPGGRVSLARRNVVFSPLNKWLGCANADTYDACQVNSNTHVEPLTFEPLCDVSMHGSGPEGRHAEASR